jgi:hypothetical protein
VKTNPRILELVLFKISLNFMADTEINLDTILKYLLLQQYQLNWLLLLGWALF